MPSVFLQKEKKSKDKSYWKKVEIRSSLKVPEGGVKTAGYEPCDTQNIPEIPDELANGKEIFRNFILEFEVER